jgi:hypothetical protein
MKRHLVLGVAVLWVVALGFAIGASATQPEALLAGTSVRLTILASIGVIIAYGRFFGTRRALVLLVGLHLFTQVWLQLEWAWWNLPVLRWVNVFCILITTDTFAAILASLTLLLARHDISVLVLCTAVLGWSIFLFVAVEYCDNLSCLLWLTPRELLPLDALVASLCYLSLAGLIAFITHSIRLLFNEWTFNSREGSPSVVETTGILNERG